MKRAKKESDSYLNQVKDLSKQVQMLLNELNALKGGTAALAPVGQVDIAAGDVGVAEVTAGDIIMERLVEFKDIEALQTQNRNLLVVARELATDNESVRKYVEAAAESRVQVLEEKFEGKLKEVEAQRKQNLEVLEKTVRERDFYRQYLKDMSSGDMTSEAGGPQAKSNGVRELLQEQEAAKKYKARCEDLEAELRTIKTEAKEHSRQLREEALTRREEAAAARAAKASAEASVEFERQRNTRAQEALDAQRQELLSVQQRESGTAQRLVAEQQRLATLTLELDLR